MAARSAAGPDPALGYRRLSGDPGSLQDGPAILLDPSGTVLVRDGEPPRFPLLSEVAIRSPVPAETVVHQVATWNSRPVYVLPRALAETGSGPLREGTFRALYAA